MTVRIRRGTPADLPLLSSLLGAAFATDPLVETACARAGDVPAARAALMSWVVRTSDNVARYLRWGFSVRARIDVGPVTVVTMFRPTRPQG